MLPSFVPRSPKTAHNFLKLSSWYFHVTAMQNPKRGHFKGEILFKNSEFFMNIK